MPTTDTALAKRAKLRSDNELAKCTNAKTEALYTDPTRLRPWTAIPEPKRLKLRKDNELPAIPASKADMEEPSRAMPRTETADPRREKERSEQELPMVRKLKVERELPERANSDGGRNVLFCWGKCLKYYLIKPCTTHGV